MPIVLPLTSAIEGLATLLGTTAVSSKYFARLLREDGRGMWPDIGRGHRSGRVRIRNLLFHIGANILCEGQPGDGPRVAHEFSLLRFYSKEESQGLVPEGSNALYPPTVFHVNHFPSYENDQRPGAFLIDEVADWIEQAAFKIKETGKIDHNNWPDWPVIRITLGSDYHPMSATVTRNDQNISHKTETRFYNVDPGNLLSPITVQPGRRNRLARTEVIIGGNELDALAGFVAHFGEVDLLTNSLEAPGSASEENTTPETTKPAGTGIHDGLQDEPPATKQTAPSTRRSLPSAKEGSNRSSKPVVSRLQAHSRPAIERTRHHGAYWANAASP